MLSNHQAVTASALYNAGVICGNSDFIERSNYFLNKIEKQSHEGWFEEYEDLTLVIKHILFLFSSFMVKK